MWKTFWKSGGHYLTGLATIATIGALIATGHTSSGVGVPIISGVGFGLTGIGAVHAATATTPTTKPPGS